MKSRKLKKLAITAVMTILLLSFAITVFAASQHYEFPVNTTAANKSRVYTNVIAGDVSGKAFGRIVNQGTGNEYITSKFGSSSTGSKPADGSWYPLSSSYTSGGSVTVKMSRATSGTTLQGVVEADVIG